MLMLDPVAALDQIRAEMRGVAVTTRGYFDSLVDAGFSEEHAMQLARDWHGYYWQTLHTADGAREAE